MRLSGDGVQWHLYILGRPESCWLPVMQNKFNSLDTAATTNFAYRDGETISPKHLRAGRIEHRYHSGVIEMSITVEENKEGRIILPPWPEDALARAECHCLPHVHRSGFGHPALVDSIIIAT